MPAHVRRSFAVCLLVLPFLLLGQASPAAASALTWIGPDGGPVNALVLQPGSSKILYAGTRGGVFKSVDGGATWIPPGEGPPVTNVLSVAVDPAHPATVYAGLDQGGVHRSSDGGAHWMDIGGGLPAEFRRPSVRSLVVAPSGAVYAGTDLGVFRSLKGDDFWQPLNQGLPQGGSVISLEIDPSRPQRMYAGLPAGGLYRSDNGGTRWTRLKGIAGSLPVEDIAVSPASPNVVYAALSNGVARSFDSGATWLPPTQDLTGYLTSLAAHPTLPGTVYAGASDGVFRSADRGATWVRVSDGLSDPSVQTLAIDPAHPATLWAGTASNSVRLGGVFQTTNAAASWMFRSNGLAAVDIRSLAIDPHDPATLFAALGSLGLFRSRDRGLHWTPLPVPEVAIIWDVEVDPMDPSIVYAAITLDGPLLKSTDGGDTWARYGTSPGGGLMEIEIDPANPSIMYGGEGFSGFYKSTDAGATWVRSPSSPFVSPRQIVIAPGILYAVAQLPPVGGTPGANLRQMFRSLDAGQTWQVVIHFDQGPLTLAVSPTDPKTVYAALRNGMIQRSTDGGDTWQNITAFSGVASLAVAPGSPGSPELLYVALSGQGIYATKDGGANWIPVMRGDAALSFGQIFLDPEDPERLYVAAINRGILALHEPEPCVPGLTTLCLQEGRFRIEAAWTDFLGGTGIGHPIPMTHETGGLWFFTPTNLELVVKVLDGRDTNGKFWVFVASLTSVDFTLAITGTETGKQKVYYNPPGHMASFADTDAF
jgi:photosystem II stability/assembly factor-like uncharacterized protein